MADAVLDAPQGTRVAVESLHQLQAPGAFGTFSLPLDGSFARSFGAGTIGTAAPGSKRTSMEAFGSGGEFCAMSGVHANASTGTKVSGTYFFTTSLSRSDPGEAAGAKLAHNRGRRVRGKRLLQRVIAEVTRYG